MKHKYESELTNCVKEMENLRVIVIDVVSQQSEQKAPLQARTSMKVKHVANNEATPVPHTMHFVQSSTGEPTLIPEMTYHAQSEKALGVMGMRNSLHKRAGVGGPLRGEDTTSSESPVRQPLVKPNVLKQRSGRFSSHEQFSINSSQNQTARFSGDFMKVNKGVTIMSEYGEDRSNLSKSTTLMSRFSDKNRIVKRDDSASSSSLSRTAQKFTLRLTDVESRQSKSTNNTNKIRYRAAAHESNTIPEHTEEDYASVFESNRRTVDLVKQTMQAGGHSVFQQAKRETKIKHTQDLQNMLSNLY